MRQEQNPGGSIRQIISNIAVTVGILATATGLCILVSRLEAFDHTDAYTSMIFILAVLLISHFTNGYLYGVAASVLGVLAVNYFFTYPYFAFNFSLPGYSVTMACMLTVSILTSTLTTRVKLHERAKRDADREIIRSNLLRAVSHDLRTPLTSILGANSALMENGDRLDEAQRNKLHTEIAEDAQWLIRMVENLLTITRIRQNESARIQKTPEAVEEVLAESVTKFHKRFPTRPISVHVPDALLICPMDAMLIEQVLLNLMENAVEHGGNVTAIDLSVEQCGTDIAIRVRDNGCGVSREQLKHLFEDDGRAAAAAPDAKRNMGIGLSVCNAIIRAHGGVMQAVNNDSGGLTVSFTLPTQEDEDGG